MKKNKNKKLSANGKKQLPKSIPVHYIKTSNYRSYHADGVFGGLTPNKKIYMEFFLQRQVTPQMIEYKVTDKGELGEEVKREGKEGFVREIEAGIIMDLEVAKVVRDWLDDKIKMFDELSSGKKEGDSDE